MKRWGNRYTLFGILLVVLTPHIGFSQHLQTSEAEDALIKEHRASRAKPASAVASPAAEDVEEIAFTTTQCLGPCPSYTVHFFRDGRVTFVPYFTRGKQATGGRISQEKFHELAKAALSAGFFKLESTYNIGPTDQSAVYTLVAAPQARKVVMDYARRGPEQLRQFESTLKEAARDAVGLPESK